MSQTERYDALCELIVERLFLDRRGLAATDIEPDADLMEKYGVDSVELFEIVVALDEEYGVQVPEEEFSIELYRSVAKLAELIDKYGDG